jgi:hypothetical protein
MPSVLNAPSLIKTVKDPRPILPERPVRDQARVFGVPTPAVPDPTEAERIASESAGLARNGMEGWRKAECLVVLYRRLYEHAAQLDASLARADERELNRRLHDWCEPAPMTSAAYSQLVNPDRS